MDRHLENNERNGVNGGFRLNPTAASPGRDENYLRRVSPDRHPATVEDTRELQAGTQVEATARIPNRTEKRIAAWNVRSLIRIGKADNVAAEAERLSLDILGLSEVRWPGVSQLTVGNYELIYSGSELHTGVGIMLRKETAKCLLGYWAVSDRVLMVKLRGSPFNISIVQVYAPTEDHSDQEIEIFYEQLNAARKQAGSQDIVIVMGDFNAKIGRGREGEVVGPFGLGERNSRGDRLSEWCAENEQVIMNTWFRHHPRLLWTWKSPGDRYRNQIDYISINKRFRNSVAQVRTYPGADCGSDHNPVVATMEVKLKKLKKRSVNKMRDLGRLRRDEDVKRRYNIVVRNRFEALPVENEGDGQWSKLQKALNEAADEVVPNKERTMRQKWMNENILEKMNRRRLLKNKTAEYKRIDKEIREDCTRAKDRWLNEQCAEVERLETVNPRIMHNRIKEMTGRVENKRCNTIKDKNGDIVMEKEEVKQRWKEYISELYDDEREDFEIRDEDCVYSPPILPCEVSAALKEMANGKAAGEDGIAVEMLSVLGEWGVELVTEIANSIYETGRLPEPMTRSVCVTLPKKPGAIECNKFRIISIISQLSKVVLRIVLRRVKNVIMPEIGKEQYGFMKGKGTSNAIFILRMLGERAVEMQRDLFLCFIDYEKAFDTVRHADLLTMLKNINIGGKDLRIIRNLYFKQTAAVRIENELTDWVEIKRGVRQGCVLSPILFSLYGEMIMRHIEDMEGFRVGGCNINNVRYADDTVLIADSAEKLQRLIDRVDSAGEELGLKINRGKTECMVISKRNPPPLFDLEIGNESIKKVHQFKYLGSILGEDGRCEQEIRTRIGIAKTAFGKMKNVVTSRHIGTDTKIRVIKAYVWATLLYGCESWTISKEMERRLEAFEMWCYRRMMRVSWTERRTNQSILDEIQRSRELMKNIRKRQLGFLGHVLRREELENLSLTGRIDGQRGRGRPRVKYMDGLRKAIGGRFSTGEIIQMSRDRERWKSMTANVFSDTAQR